MLLLLSYWNWIFLPFFLRKYEHFDAKMSLLKEPVRKGYQMLSIMIPDYRESQVQGDALWAA